MASYPRHDMHRFLFFCFLFFMFTSVSTSSHVSYEYDHFLTVARIVEEPALFFARQMHAADGRIVPVEYPRHGILQPLLEVPLYWTARRLGVPAENQTILTFVSFLLIPFICALIVLIILDFALRLFSPRTAWLLAIFTAFATALFPYAAMGLEPLLTLTLTAAVYFLFRCRLSRSYLDVVLAGMATGAAVNTKVYAPAFVIVLALYGLYAIWPRSAQDRAHSMRLAVAGIVGSLPFLFLYVWFEYLRSGVWFQPPLYVNEFFGMSTPLQDWYGYLFSPGKSIFIFNPPLLLLIGSVATMYKRWRGEVLVIAGLCATILLLFAPAWGGFCDELWGPRYLVAVIPLFVLLCGPMVETLSAQRVGRILLVVLFVAGLYVQVLGLAFDSFKPVVIAQQAGASDVAEYSFVPQFAPVYINSINLVSGVRRAFGGSSLTFRVVLMRNNVTANFRPDYGPSVDLGREFDRSNLYFNPRFDPSLPATGPERIRFDQFDLPLFAKSTWITGQLGSLVDRVAPAGLREATRDALGMIFSEAGLVIVYTVVFLLPVPLFLYILFTRRLDAREADNVQGTHDFSGHSVP